MLDYLDHTLGRELPRPVYETTSVAKPTVPAGQKALMEPATRFDPRQSLFHKVPRWTPKSNH